MKALSKTFRINIFYMNVTVTILYSDSKSFARQVGINTAFGYVLYR